MLARTGDAGVFHYKAFGRSIRSNSPLTGISSSAFSESPDIFLWFGCRPDEVEYPCGGDAPAGDSLTVPRWNLEQCNDTWCFWRCRSGCYSCLDYTDGPLFVFDRNGSNIWCDRLSRLAPAEVSLYITGPVLGLALRLQGVLCLHAGAVVSGSRAIAFAGPSGSGKSTITSVFLQKGFKCLTDDVLAIDETGGRIMVQPGLPRIRLWDDAVRAIHGPAVDLPSLLPDWEKRYIDLDDETDRLYREPAQLSAIYLLGERTSFPVSRCADLSPRESLIGLVGNTYRNDMLGKELRAGELLALGRLIAHIPVRRLAISNNLQELDNLPDLIEMGLAVDEGVSGRTPR